MVFSQLGALPRATQALAWQHEAGTQSASLVQAAPAPGVGSEGPGSTGAGSLGAGSLGAGVSTGAGSLVGGDAGSVVVVVTQPAAESAHRTDSVTTSVLVIGGSSWVRLGTMPVIAPPDHPSQLASLIDHTLLKADATEHHIEALCHEALQHHFFAVCVNGAHVAQAAKLLSGSNVSVAAVVGFPLGAMATRAKVREAEIAIEDGARELDMVLRIDLVKRREHARLGEDIARVVSAAGGAPVKVILETALLGKEEIVRACRVAEQAGARFVKTSTGFTSGGDATVETVALLRASVSESIGVKASGGVRTFAHARALVEAGATRLGTSAGVALVTGGENGETPY
jgi:deoxyribose-phosphate aldolase